MPSDFLNAVKYWLPKQNWIYTKKMYEGRKSARKKGWSFAHTSTIATLPPNSIFYLLIRLPPPLPSILNTFVAAASVVFLAYQYLWQIQIKTFCVPFDSLQFLKWTQFRVSNERGVSIPPCFCIRNRKAGFRRGDLFTSSKNHKFHDQYSYFYISPGDFSLNHVNQL